MIKHRFISTTRSSSWFIGLLLSLGFLTQFLTAQTAASLSGRVLDPTGAPVAAVVVTLHSRDGALRLSTMSGTEGSYRFNGVAQGEYLLEASAPGLAAAQDTPVRLAGGANSTQDVQLQLARVASRVVVTAAGVAESTDQTSKSFEVIDGAQLESRKTISVVEALRQTPGMRVLQLGGPGALTSLFVRGLRSFDTSLLIDGFRLRDVAAPQSDAGAFLGDMQLLDTDRIEVLRGSGSSLYGTNAIGGVVNIVTDQGGGPARGEVSLEGGGLGMFRGLARVSGGAWKDRLLYSAGVAHWNVTSGVDGDDRYRNSSLQTFLQARMSSRSSLTGRFWLSDSFAQLNISPFAADLASLPTALPVPAIAGRTYTPAPDDPDARRSSHFYTGLGTYARQFAPGASLRIHYSGVSTERDGRDGPGGPRFQPAFPNSSIFRGRTDTVNARTDFGAGKYQLITGGYEFEREHFENLATDQNPAPSLRLFADTHLTQNSHAIYAQDQITLPGNPLRISVSGRWQHFDLSRPAFAGGAPRYAVPIPAPPDAFTGDVAASYFLVSKGTKLRAHGGNSYRAPSLYERFGTSFFGGSFSPYGDPRLAPERAISLDAGFDQYFAGSRVRLSATYFYTRLREVIGFDSSGVIQPGTDPYGRFGGYRNTAGGFARGFELNAEIHPVKRTRVLTSYTYTKAMERVSALVGGSLRSIRIPDHMFSVTALQSIASRVDIAATLVKSSSYIFPLFVGGSRPFLFDGIAKADLAVSYRIPLGERRSFEFFTRVENFLDHTYYESGFPTPGAFATGGLKVHY